MATKTYWICDGCDEQILAPERSSDWKTLSVDIHGSGGYPLSGVLDGDHRWLLCPACQRKFADVVRPTRWARPAKEDPSPDVSDGEKVTQ